MKTIYIANSHTGKSVKKILFNRSRSGNQILICNRQNSRNNTSPFRNSIGLKSYPDTSNHKANLLKIKPNQNQYQLQPKQLNKKMQQTKTKYFQLNSQRKTVQKQIQKKQAQKGQNIYQQKNTAHASKYSKQNISKIKNTDSQYFFKGYQSPSIKLKQLEREKCVQKKKAIQNIQKVIQIQDEIKQSRSKHKLETQMFEQLLNKLKKRSLLGKLQPTKGLKEQSILKTSKSLETQEGDSSNQY